MKGTQLYRTCFWLRYLEHFPLRGQSQSAWHSRLGLSGCSQASSYIGINFIKVLPAGPRDLLSVQDIECVEVLQRKEDIAGIEPGRLFLETSDFR